MKQRHNHLKVQYNITQDENTRLKTKIAAMGEQQSRIEKELSNKITPGKKGPDNFLTTNLKKQIRTLKLDNAKKTEEIKTLKSDIKLCKLKELESDVSTYQSECIRLKQIINEQALKMEQLESQPIIFADDDRLRSLENHL
jgi:hypothetical protein